MGWIHPARRDISGCHHVRYAKRRARAHAIPRASSAPSSEPIFAERPDLLRHRHGPLVPPTSRAVLTDDEPDPLRTIASAGQTENYPSQPMGRQPGSREGRGPQRVCVGAVVPWDPVLDWVLFSLSQYRQNQPLSEQFRFPPLEQGAYFRNRDLGPGCCRGASTRAR